MAVQNNPNGRSALSLCRLIFLHLKPCRGRGDHPKMGKIKKRIYPRDITINIGVGEPVPEHPYPGQTWREVRHDKTVTWLAYWKDTVDPKSFKYVFLGANSTFKADSDLQVGGVRRVAMQSVFVEAFFLS